MNLLTKVEQVSKKAASIGTLQTLKTKYEVLSGEIPYIIRTLTGPNLITIHNSKDKKRRDPFLPYDNTLFVKNLTDDHILLLNKFNVVDNHLLIVTKEFIHQEGPLAIDDFEALGMVMMDIDGLAFYNSAKTAGASQTHRHLQLVPRSAQHHIPIEKVIKKNATNKLKKIADLPYNNRCILLPHPSTQNWEKIVLQHYEEALFQLNLCEDEKPLPYNLLLTNNWLLAAPRTKESYQGISINGLGIAGNFLVKNDILYDLIKKEGPSKILSNVTK